MTEQEPRQVIPRKDGGFFDDLTLRVKLILRLLGDRRVNFFLKLLPVGALLYLVIPDIAPGPIDDALIVWLGGYLFIELCPPHIVQEHMEQLTSVIEGTFREVDDRKELEGD